MGAARGPGEGAANGDLEPTGGGSGGGAPSQAFGFWGALVAIVAVIAGPAASAIASGTPARLKMRCNAAVCDLNFMIDAEALGLDEEGFIADDRSDSVPPLPW